MREALAVNAVRRRLLNEMLFVALSILVVLATLAIYAQRALSLSELFVWKVVAAFVVGSAWMSILAVKHILSDRFGAATVFHLQYIILGASKSDYFNLSGREYDYGPGVGYKFGAQFRLNKYEFLSLWHEGHLIHSINGNRAEHFVTLTRGKLDYPIRGFIGVGAEYVLYIADRHYQDFEDVHAKNPELRIYFVWKTD